MNTIPLLADLRVMPYPKQVLMCPPDYFDVVDVKNPHMEGQTGKVDRDRARENWDALKHAFEGIGLIVKTIPAAPGREDMVFCANQTFTGLTADGRRMCVLSRMKYPSRQAEVPEFEKWFRGEGYTVKSLDLPTYTFEGGGDAVWHPGRGLIWGGVGPRTSEAAYAPLSEIFQVPVIPLKMVTREFYHLDTCFSALDEETVLIYPEAFEPASLKLIEGVFPRVIRASSAEANSHFACNAAAFLGKYVVLENGSPNVVRQLRSLNFEVIEVDTGEFLKSGGSVYCMKMVLF